MRKLSLVSIAGLVFLIACNSSRKPSSENFTNQYLSQHGNVCTSICRQFPIDIPASAQQSQYGFGPQLAALAKSIDLA